MKEYEALYIDDAGDQQEFSLISSDTRTAIQTVLELCPDARRIVRCAPAGMWDDEN